jgi:hypothetical protein
MRTLRALSTLVVLGSFAASGVAACSGSADKSLGNGGKGGSSPGSGAMGGSSTVIVTGGSGGNGAQAGSGAQGGGSDTGGTDPGTAAAGGEDGVPECGALTGLGECGGMHLEAKLRTVNMLLVIDKSGSMTDKPKGFGTDKWSAMKSALATALDKVQTQINFGLVLYPYNPIVPIPENCQENCCAVSTEEDAVLVSVKPGTQSVAQINAALEQSDPGGGTPTASALAAALDYFTNGKGAALEGDNYVLLATDGGPNCNDTLSCDADTCTTNLDDPTCIGNCCKDDETRNQCLDDANVKAELDALTAAGISTFVVGIPGTEAYASYLDGFAQAGGVPATGGAHSYYAVSADQGVEGLVGVFETITTQLVRSCDVPLPEPPSKVELVNVAVDCNLVPRNTDDAKSGWDFDQTPEPTSVILHGPVCNGLQENGAQRIDVVFGCPTVR